MRPFAIRLLMTPCLALGLGGCLPMKRPVAGPPSAAYPDAATRAAIHRPLEGEGLARWQASCRVIPEALERDHPEPWFRQSRDTFRAQVAALERELPGLSEYQAALRWKLILAGLGDEHTSLWEEASWTRGWPLRVRAMGERLIVTRAPAEDPALLGAEVLRVGGLPLEAYLALIDPFLAAPVPVHRRAQRASAFPASWAWLAATGRLPTGLVPELEFGLSDGSKLLRRFEVQPSEALLLASPAPPAGPCGTRNPDAPTSTACSRRSAPSTCATGAARRIPASRRRPTRIDSGERSRAKRSNGSWWTCGAMAAATSPPSIRSCAP